MVLYWIMLTFCVTAQRADGKSLFNYDVNPEHDILADEFTSHVNFWPSSKFHGSPVIRYKHHAKNGKNNGRRGHGSPHAYGHTDTHQFMKSSEEYDGSESDESFEFPHHASHPHHPHHISLGQAKKHGPPHRQSHEPPRRFPPPPVYDEDFINPWALPATTPKPFIVQQPPLTTPASLKFTPTTPTPPRSSSTASDDQLLYDIDVRFGRD